MAAPKKGFQAVFGEPKFPTPITAALELARVIDSKRLSATQHQKMANELIPTNRALVQVALQNRRTARSLAKGRVALLATCVGMAAWMWQTGGRHRILMERAKASEAKDHDK